jgi:NADH-quinone oxidoreductase subunit L
MFSMGGLRRRMPVTFWTFLIGGLALSGFPLLTAGFWSKDEILADAFGRGHIAVFVALALAALLTAFYTMRQISLTFLGSPRTSAAEHAHEPALSMRIPLVGLAVFAVAAGWIGIPEHFPALGGLVPNWVHGFLGASLAEGGAESPFLATPLLISVAAALGGLTLGWWVYRNVAAGAPDPLERALGPVHRILKNKYYFDEFYEDVFVRPAYWLAETVVAGWIDRGLIDGTLHAIGRVSLRIGTWLRQRFDLPVINGGGDLVGAAIQRGGAVLRFVQTGRVQQYLVVGLVFVGIVFTGLLLLRP